jgi:hypothetical protein
MIERVWTLLVFNELPDEEWCHRLGFHRPPRDDAEEAVMRVWQELMTREVVKVWEIAKALDEGRLPELFLEKKKAYVHWFGHNTWTRRFK